MLHSYSEVHYVNSDRKMEDGWMLKKKGPMTDCLGRAVTSQNGGGEQEDVRLKTLGAMLHDTTVTLAEAARLQILLLIIYGLSELNDKLKLLPA